MAEAFLGGSVLINLASLRLCISVAFNRGFFGGVGRGALILKVRVPGTKIFSCLGCLLRWIQPEVRLSGQPAWQGPQHLGHLLLLCQLRYLEAGSEVEQQGFEPALRCGILMF